MLDINAHIAYARTTIKRDTAISNITASFPLILQSAIATPLPKPFQGDI
ncbi:MAG: hypothetical protein JSV11_10825 [Nitrospiraceae bacterium]|nr:MAG: hypothetical protein JSU99_10105 [Nitrospiraceae bacterium]UCH44775.1 MAG: hypothetical protein JSV11_10825 [Nitrospiraceae bacterium]